MTVVLIISVVIVFVVLLLSVVTTSKAYSYEHKVDSLDDNPHLNDQNPGEVDTNKQEPSN